MKALMVRNAIASLDGTSYTSLEALQDAVLPLFGPLTSLLPGEGHRNLVDRLIAGGWVVREQDTLVVKLPPTSSLDSDVRPETPAPTPYLETTRTPHVARNEADAITAITNGNYREAIRILATLL